MLRPACRCLRNDLAMRIRISASTAAIALALALLAPQPADAQAGAGDRPATISEEAYPNAGDAIRAGDIEAYLGFLAADEGATITTQPFRIFLLTIEAMAEEDFGRARTLLGEVREDGETSQLSAYLGAWLLAFEGDGRGAISKHRAAASGLPGLTADLSLAAMLEGLGRNEEALAVYASLTPGEIDAPEHDFDITGIYFGHVQTVIARRALLLRRLGRIEEAKDVYRRLAEAEPEQAVRYASALASLDSGEGLDDEALTVRTALSRTLTDLSLAIWQQRAFANAQRGIRTTGFDETKGALDHAALLVSPENEDLRALVVGGLHAEAFYDGAARVALEAPELTPDLAMSAASALLLKQDREAARATLDQAIALDAPPDERIGNAIRAARLYSFLGDEATALALTTEALEIAKDDAQRAVANGAAADILQHFGRYEEALPFAREALRIDDTHDRRIYLTTVLGELGENQEALRILRTEQLGRPNDPYMLNTLGYYLVSHTDQDEEAYRILARATSLAENDAYIRDSFGWARYKFGDLEAALRIIVSARDELAPDRHWEIEDHIGDIEWHLGNKEAARKAWADALEIYPPVKVQRQLEAKLRDGLTTPAPERRPLPSISLGDDGELTERDI